MILKFKHANGKPLFLYSYKERLIDCDNEYLALGLLDLYGNPYLFKESTSYKASEMLNICFLDSLKSSDETKPYYSSDYIEKIAKCAEQKIYDFVDVKDYSAMGYSYSDLVFASDAIMSILSWDVDFYNSHRERFEAFYNYASDALNSRDFPLEKFNTPFKFVSDDALIKNYAELKAIKHLPMEKIIDLIEKHQKEIEKRTYIKANEYITNRELSGRPMLSKERFEIMMAGLTGAVADKNYLYVSEFCNCFKDLVDGIPGSRISDKDLRFLFDISGACAYDLEFDDYFHAGFSWYRLKLLDYATVRCFGKDYGRSDAEYIITQRKNLEREIKQRTLAADKNLKKHIDEYKLNGLDTEKITLSIKNSPKLVDSHRENTLTFEQRIKARFALASKDEFEL